MSEDEAVSREEFEQFKQFLYNLGKDLEELRINILDVQRRINELEKSLLDTIEAVDYVFEALDKIQTED